jgi:hypothetical protein
MRARFYRDVNRNDATRAILSRWHSLDLPDCWLVAGCLFQTIWNLQAGRSPGADIKDYDIFYFDPMDQSSVAEAHVQSHVESTLGDVGVTVEVANQARVHAWYPDFFGKPCAPLATVEEGIDRFLVLEACVGIRPREVYSPYGLEGLYAGTLTPNPLTPYRELYDQKVESYRRRWNWLCNRNP